MRGAPLIGGRINQAEYVILAGFFAWRELRFGLIRFSVLLRKIRRAILPTMRKPQITIAVSFFGPEASICRSATAAIGIAFFLFSFSFSGLLIVSAADADQNPFSPSVEQLLSGKHYQVSLDGLAKAAGGEAPLIETLLTLRLKEVPPQLGIRAERALLNFADRPDVFLALEQDAGDPGRRGLAQVIALHLDQVASETSRRRLARTLADRTKREEAFRPYGELLRKSSDPTIRALLD